LYFSEAGILSSPSYFLGYSSNAVNVTLYFALVLFEAASGLGNRPFKWTDKKIPELKNSGITVFNFGFC